MTAMSLVRLGVEKNGKSGELRFRYPPSVLSQQMEMDLAPPFRLYMSEPDLPLTAAFINFCGRKAHQER